MTSSVCTFFEGHYHYGVAALINSLFQQGFRGSICVGYKGGLPDWADLAIEDTSIGWLDSKTWEVNKELKVHFLPISAEFHLTNYKPYFMLRLLDGIAAQSDAVVFFDPDIVVNYNWGFFENWMKCGVALVHEIANTPMPATHPIRVGWNEVIEKSGRVVTNKLSNYFNAGFCGVTRNNAEFLRTWCQIIDTAVKYFDFNLQTFVQSAHNKHFYAGDQDAMNIAAMCTNSPLSEIGPHGMDFVNGDAMMSHATGTPKPWKKNFFLSAINGVGPTRAERAYWRYANGLIHNYSSNVITRKKFDINAAALIGRFYSR